MTTAMPAPAARWPTPASAAVPVGRGFESAHRGAEPGDGVDSGGWLAERCGRAAIRRPRRRQPGSSSCETGEPRRSSVSRCSSTASASRSQVRSSTGAGRRPKRAPRRSGCSRMPCTVVASTGPSDHQRFPVGDGLRLQGVNATVADLVAVDGETVARRPRRGQLIERQRDGAGDLRRLHHGVDGEQVESVRGALDAVGDRGSIGPASWRRHRRRAHDARSTRRLARRRRARCRRSHAMSAATCLEPGQDQQVGAVEIDRAGGEPDVGDVGRAGAARRGSTRTGSARRRRRWRHQSAWRATVAPSSSGSSWSSIGEHAGAGHPGQPRQIRRSRLEQRRVAAELVEHETGEPRPGGSVGTSDQVP